MNEDIKSALKNAITKPLSVLHQVRPRCQIPYVRWRKHEDGSWRGTNEQRISLALVFIAAEQALQAAASDFANLFFSQYPEYGPGRLVGVSGLAFEQLACDPACIPERAIAYIWEERGTFEFQQSDIENAVKDFEDFIEQSTISLRFQA